MSTLHINGRPVEVEVEAETPLLWVLRAELGLVGTRFGCGQGLCGACTVLLEGQPVRACTLPIAAVGPVEVTTIEGLQGPVAEALQAAWSEVDVVQCGYCQSGQLLAAHALLQRHPRPTDADIDASMNGNICRCGTYPRIRRAIHLAAIRLG